MRRALKWIVVAIAVLALVLAAAFAGAVWMGERKMQRMVDAKVVPVPFAKDAAAIRRGKYLFETRGCAQCHGADGGGRVHIDDPGGLYVKTPDITTGRGGVVANYDEGDWVRTVRRGVDPSGRPLIAMPSEDFSRMSDADLAALVAYVRSLPPVAGSGPEIRLPLLVKALYGLGLVRDAAEKIDPREPPSPAVPEGPTPEYGRYVAQACVGCHRADFSGGRIDGAPPDWPPAARLAPGPGSAMGRYASLAQFAAMMRTGKRPDGTAVSPVMPFASLGNLDDTDLAALYAYLSTLPVPRAAGR
ncbi:MAG TPA: cytochrome c [Usitatibacter sp.]|nr:cytochrome c [Usitatibacter sp.]